MRFRQTKKPLTDREFWRRFKMLQTIHKSKTGTAHTGQVFEKKLEIEKIQRKLGLRK